MEPSRSHPEMERFVCVHAHFYQPPRQHPGLEEVEAEDSAHPYHDWNERITAECYRPLSAARILDAAGRIQDIVNLYSRISFNFGPTLLTWLERRAGDVYRRILEADQESSARFSGHGSALAQVYHHAIMPLANARDRATQVRWGILDFEARFGRAPEGMWLAETAVDLATLEELARQGLRFTILAPRQAARVRPLGAPGAAHLPGASGASGASRAAGDGAWREVAGGAIDPKRAYLQRLPSGRSIALFFYDGPVSQAVAFEGLLHEGERFAARLRSGLDERRATPQLMHIATDGETYGHHHRFGEMALASALERVEKEGWARLTNYGEFLARHPPAHEVEIVEATSWSCGHGVGRWREDCGCSAGRASGYRQHWRAPLRRALDGLCDALAAPFEQGAGELLASPWRARDEYARLLVARSVAAEERFFAEHQRRPLAADERRLALEWLELQRAALHMFTSCGWFFDDLAGIETLLLFKFAARALDLLRERTGLAAQAIEEAFLCRLAEAHSNEAEQGDGRALYLKTAARARVDLERAAAHFAARRLFEPPAARPIPAFAADLAGLEVEKDGERVLVTGSLTVEDRRTHAHGTFCASFAYFGGQDLAGGVAALAAGDCPSAARELRAAFRARDRRRLEQSMALHFGAADWGLRALFADDLIEVVKHLLEEKAAHVEAEYRRIHGELIPLARSLSALELPLPWAFRPAAAVALNGALRALLGEAEPDPAAVRDLLAQARDEQVKLGGPLLARLAEERLKAAVDGWLEERWEEERLARVEREVELIRLLPFPVDLFPAQAACFAVARAGPGRTAGSSSFVARLQRLRSGLGVGPA